MGQIAHPGHGRRGAAALAAVLAAGVVLTGCGESLSSAPTTLAGVWDVSVVHPDGAVVTGVNGMRLHRGDVVRTGADSHARAELVTRGRRVYVGSLASVQVFDGARQSLRQGALVVDSDRGPGLRLQVAALSVDIAGGSALRAERNVTLRLGALVGSATVTSDNGQSLRLPALDQVVVAGDALPDSGTPLRLTDDDGEAHAAPDLVGDDQALLALATGIDSTGSSTARAVTAAWHGALESAPAVLAASEQVLPVVIAAADHAKDAQARYREAISLRIAGGSWGVVAHLLGTRSAAVLAALDRLEQGIATGQVGSVPTAISFVAGGGSGSAGGSPGGHGGGGDGNGGGGSPSASPTPSPSDSSLVGSVTDTVGEVLKLLPTPTPTAIVPPLKLPVAVPSLPTVPLPGVAVTPAPAPSGH